MKIMALGKDYEGNPLFKPIDEQKFREDLVKALSRNAPSLRSRVETTTRGITFRGEIDRRLKDSGDPKQAGWTFLVAENDPRKAELVEIMRPLAKHRGMEDPSSPMIFNGGREETWGDWLQDHYFARELDGKTVPQYILMVGSPDKLPFHFQSLMDTVANVGRLEFDTLDDYRNYVAKVIRLEKEPDPVVKREVILFAPDGGPQDPTYYSRKYMVEPLESHIRNQLSFRTSALLGDAATKTKFVATLRDAKPALVYTASHGLGLIRKPLDQQKALNGAICCQTNGPLTPGDLFGADDVPTDVSFLEGAVFFQFACFGYGTPAQSEYAHWLDDMPERYAQADFVAALPKRLLAHPRGPISYIGHLDTAFLHAFADPSDLQITGRWHDRIQPFVHAVDQILEVQPAAFAMEDMNKKYSVYNILLNGIYDQLKRGSFVWTTEKKKRFVDTWIIRSDAQNYLVFGDPAAHLRIPEL